MKGSSQFPAEKYLSQTDPPNRFTHLILHANIIPSNLLNALAWAWLATFLMATPQA